MLNKILIAEDEPALRNLVKTCLVKEGYSVIEAKDGQEALDLFYSENVSLVILDIMMPQLDGFEVLKTIRIESTVPVLMLTARNTEYDELHGLKLGADDYITKPFSPAVLVSRVKAVLKRSGMFADNDISANDILLKVREHEVYVKDEKINLTPKEFDLLQYLIQNKNIVHSREKLLSAVWGYDFFGDARTVDTHMKCLRTKLKQSGDCIKTVRKYGYKLEG
ncbi:MAG: response regulator transcription factor [Clostridia bacterium]|jgi:DNA-binding response OmpR family regulator|nr:response regulator transcription factor [Clostridia bacterium]MDD3093376.1 response regulator transcription factor [Clostridia bacterium]MDD4543283.1 response regulator transcription factor [Clostridia bacterium]NLF36526.1 response regulator transcription factor [Clostridiaceae bacterium]